MDQSIASAQQPLRFRREIFAWLAAAVACLWLAMVASPVGPSGVAASSHAILMKLRGDAPNCPWSRIITFAPAQARYDHLRARYAHQVVSGLQDESLPIEQVGTPKRTFWAPQSNTLAEDLAFVDWLAEFNPKEFVHRGEVVIDFNPQLGALASRALEAGAVKVVLVQPDSVLHECLRRTFSSEIARGKLAILDRSMPLDEILAEYALPSPHLINLPDGEFLISAWSQRHPPRPRLLAAAFGTLSRHAYEVSCGPCIEVRRQLEPAALFLR